MRTELRQSVRRRYESRCGYCGVTETATGAKLTIDHFQPRTQGGDDSPDNLVYACHACNEFKGDYWQTEPDLKLLHPLLDEVAEHYHSTDDGTLEALTDRGANHLRRLHLNREELIQKRLDLQEIVALQAQCASLTSRVLALEQLTRTTEAKMDLLHGFSEEE